MAVAVHGGVRQADLHEIAGLLPPRIALPSVFEHFGIEALRGTRMRNLVVSAWGRKVAPTNHQPAVVRHHPAHEAESPDWRLSLQSSTGSDTEQVGRACRAGSAPGRAVEVNRPGFNRP